MKNEEFISSIRCFLCPPFINLYQNNSSFFHLPSSLRQGYAIRGAFSPLAFFLISAFSMCDRVSSKAVCVRFHFFEVLGFRCQGMKISTPDSFPNQTIQPSLNFSFFNHSSHIFTIVTPQPAKQSTQRYSPKPDSRSYPSRGQFPLCVHRVSSPESRGSSAKSLF